ncbi:MAG: ATP-binding protein [Bacteroidota bacterium]|nr:ATP-binding protein [Candidatus Kapabacteria bacterium]MDW8220568.1 ATP-binding protein [Bacteroidota bacterium]
MVYRSLWRLRRLPLIPATIATSASVLVLLLCILLQQLHAPVWLWLLGTLCVASVSGTLCYLIVNAWLHKVRYSVDKIVDFSDAVRNGAASVSIMIEHDELPVMQRAHEAINKLAAKSIQDLREMKRLERMRSEFLGSVSHELRTPIFAVQGFLETLLDGALEDEAVRWQFLERAYSNTVRLHSLLTDLVDISRIESGEMRLSFRYFPLLPLVREIMANLEPATEELSITTAIECHIDEDTDVYGDRDRLAQVLTNLLDNAIKYNVKNGSVTVLLESVYDGKGVEEVRVSVRDTGIGIAPEHHSRIFERFYRVDKTRSRSVGGTGLGLAIVKHILEAHKSAIYVHSAPGQGTTISFTLRK